MIVHFLTNHFSYYFLFIWSILEGELGLTLAGFLSNDGHFIFYKVILIAIMGALIGDTTLYIFGRFFEKKAKIWLNKYKKQLDMVKKWLNKNVIWVLLFERFIYGTHIPSILTIGISKYPFYKFLFFDIIGVSLWAITFTTLGFYFGNSIIDLIIILQKNILVLIILIIIILFLKAKK